MARLFAASDLVAVIKAHLYGVKFAIRGAYGQQEGEIKNLRINDNKITCKIGFQRFRITVERL